MPPVSGIEQCFVHLQILLGVNISCLVFLQTHRHTDAHTRTRRQEIWGGGVWLYYLGCGDGIMGIVICPNAPYYKKDLLNKIPQL